MRFKPGPAGREARTLPRCYADPLIVLNKNFEENLRSQKSRDRKKRSLRQKKTSFGSFFALEINLERNKFRLFWSQNRQTNKQKTNQPTNKQKSFKNGMELLFDLCFLLANKAVLTRIWTLKEKSILIIKAWQSNLIPCEALSHWSLAWWGFNRDLVDGIGLKQRWIVNAV